MLLLCTSEGFWVQVDSFRKPPSLFDKFGFHIQCMMTGSSCTERIFYLQPAPFDLGRGLTVGNLASGTGKLSQNAW